MDSFVIDPDITRARTLPAEVYTDPAWFRRSLDRVMARAWLPLVDLPELAEAGSVHPFTLLPGGLDEPLVLVRGEDGRLRCFSNVCPHRGNVVVQEGGIRNRIRCGYHGRRFDLSGRFLSMPEFDGVAGLCPEDEGLRELPLESWGPLRFTSLDPAIPFAEWIRPVEEHLSGFPVDRLALDPDDRADYRIDGHWALYNDNYLEGFHVPYVHPALSAALDPKAYRYQAFDHATLQVGIARPGETAFETRLPAGHPFEGDRLGGFYFWLFPGTLLNFYPWGLSFNSVEPVSPETSRVVYRTWVWDPAKRGTGAGGDVHQTEREDQAVVRTTAQGVRSRLYRRGRYSPSQEIGVHLFHRLLQRYLCGESV